MRVWKCAYWGGEKVNVAISPTKLERLSQAGKTVHVITFVVDSLLDIDYVKLVCGLLDDGVGEGLLGGLGGLEFGFEGVADGHEFVDFGDDAVLFGYGGNGENHFSEISD